MIASDSDMTGREESAQGRSASPAPEDRPPRPRRLGTSPSPLLARAVRVAGALGMFACLVGLIATPAIRSWGLRAGAGGLDTAISQAGGGGEMLGLAADSLGAAAAGLRQAADVVGGVQLSLQDSAPILENTANLLEDQAPATIIETRQAIMGAQAGAQAIDSFLRALSVLPFTSLEYDAQDSLAEGLVDAADSLSPLPADFASLGGQIRSFSGDLDQMDEQLSALAGDMGDLADSLTDASKALRRQADSFDDLSAGLEASRARILQYTGLLGWGLGLLSLWLLVSQYGLYALGGVLLETAEWPEAVEGARQPREE